MSTMIQALAVSDALYHITITYTTQLHNVPLGSLAPRALNFSGSRRYSTMSANSCFASSTCNLHKGFQQHVKYCCTADQKHDLDWLQSMQHCN